MILQGKRDIGLYSTYSMDKWEFIAKGRGAVSIDGKLPRGNIKDKGNCG